MSMEQVAGWMMVFFGALWTGGIFIFSFERLRLWQSMPAEQFSAEFQASLLRLDPMMPILAITTAVSAAVFAFVSQGSRAWLGWSGTAMVILVIAGSVLLAEPINVQFRRMVEGRLPERVDRHRIVLHRLHVTRNVFALLAYGCLAAAVMA